MKHTKLNSALPTANKSSVTVSKSESKHPRRIHDHYGNVATDYNTRRLKDNKSANRYNMAAISNQKLSLNRNKSKREKSMFRDRLHIIDRVSNSFMNGNTDDASDFSDIKSIKGR